MSAISGKATNFLWRSIRSGVGAGALEDLARRFGLAHERIYGFKLDQPVEFVNLRAVGVGTVQKISLPKFDKEGPDARQPPWPSSIGLISTAASRRLMSMTGADCGRQSHPRPGYHCADGRNDRDPSQPHRRGRRVLEYSDHT
jgi:hypothetical protein